MSELVSSGTIGSRFRGACTHLQEQIEGLDALDAFECIDVAIDQGTAYARGSMLFTIYAIALAKEKWDLLDLSQQHGIADSFYVYASQKFGTSTKSSTIDNYIRVAKTWLVDPVQIPSVIHEFELDEGEPTFVSDEEGDSIESQTDVWDVNYAKLLAATSKAAKGQMEEEDWGLLFNPQVSQNKLLDYWRGPRQPNKRTYGLSFKRVGNFLVVFDGKNYGTIAELEAESIERDPLAKQGWARLCATLNITWEEEDDF